MFYYLCINELIYLLEKDMFTRILPLFTSVLFLLGCTSNNPEVEIVCQRDEIGNYLIKWETDPKIEGTVMISVSNNPDHFNDAPIIYSDIKDGVATYITNDNISRRFFLLNFNNQFSRIVGARAAVLDKVQNLRDLGGYKATKGKYVKWGKVYRSGDVSILGEWDSIRIQNLGVKTIIDLRTPREIKNDPPKYKAENFINIPVSIGKTADARRRVLAGEIRKGDAQIFMEDEYIQFVTDNTQQFAKVMDELLKEENYPILVNCSIGKDRTGFFSAMLLTALGVDKESVMEDYMASNQHIKIKNINDIMYRLTTDAQESVTVFLTAEEGLMDLAFHKIKQEYGSVEKYLTKGLLLTDKKRERLKDLLLY